MVKYGTLKLTPVTVRVDGIGPVHPVFNVLEVRYGTLRLTLADAKVVCIGMAQHASNV